MTKEAISELEMFRFFEMTPDLICIASKDGYLKKVNASVIHKLGYTEEELYARPVASFVHPDDKNLTASTRTNMINGKALINFQNRYITKSGNIVWLSWTSIYLPDKEIVFAIAKDVTQIKRTEKEIQDKYVKFKGLTHHFKTSIEKDRKHFAVELHEDLAQLASVVKMDIDWIGTNTVDASPELKQRIEHAAAVSQLFINTIQKISFTVSPSMLDDFGLDETLKWLSKEFTLLHSISCGFKSNYREKDLSHEMKLDFFRICQEALNNVIDQRQATHVVISIEDQGSQIRLSITDNCLKSKLDYNRKTEGLLNIQKRVASINGQLKVESISKQETRVAIIVEK